MLESYKIGNKWEIAENGKVLESFEIDRDLSFEAKLKIINEKMEKYKKNNLTK